MNADQDTDNILIMLSTADKGVNGILVLLSTADRGINDILRGRFRGPPYFWRDRAPDCVWGFLL